MSVRIGAIFVLAKGDDNRRSEVETRNRVRDYWLTTGARESSVDALELGPHLLASSGHLGFVIGRACIDEDGNEWIGVYDSECTRADRAMAADLCEKLRTSVWHVELDELDDRASVQSFGTEKNVDTSNYKKALRLLQRFRNGFIEYDALIQWKKSDVRDYLRLSFESVPHRPSAAYSGPSAEALAFREQLMGRRAFHPRVPQRTAADERTLAEHLALAEAAFVANDPSSFERHLARIPDSCLYSVEGRAAELVSAGGHALAF